MASSLTVFAFVFGVWLAYSGWKLYKYTILLLGTLVGFGSGFALGVLLADPTAVSTGQGPEVMAVIGGSLGFFVAHTAHRLAYGLSGVAVGTLIGYGVLGNLPIAVVIGLACGYATWVLHKGSVIILTAIAGGIVVAIAFGGLSQSVDFGVVVVFVAITGIGVQYGFFGSDRPVGAPETSPAHRCPACDAPCGPEDDYCGACGVALHRCQSCGGIGLQEWTYCDGCGEAM